MDNETQAKVVSAIKKQTINVRYDRPATEEFVESKFKEWN
jgi:hypothetical protein